MGSSFKNQGNVLLRRAESSPYRWLTSWPALPSASTCFCLSFCIRTQAFGQINLWEGKLWSGWGSFPLNQCALKLELSAHMYEAAVCLGCFPFYRAISGFKLTAADLGTVQSLTTWLSFYSDVMNKPTFLNNMNIPEVKILDLVGCPYLHSQGWRLFGVN